MSNSYLCKLHSQKATRVCVHEECTLYPFMCRAEDCETLHEHAQSLVTIKMPQFLDLLKSHTQTWVQSIDHAYTVLLTELQQFVELQKKELRKMVNDNLAEGKAEEFIESISNKKIQSGKDVVALRNLSRSSTILNLGETQRGSEITKRLENFKSSVSIQTIFKKQHMSFNEEVKDAQTNQDSASKPKQEKSSEFEKNLKLALADYAHVGQLNPKTSGQFVERSKIHEKQRNFQQALQDLCMALDLDSNNINALYRRALLHTQLKQPHKALTDYTHYLVHDKNSSFAFYNRAAIYIQLDKYTEALQDLNKALEIDPLLEAALLTRGKILCNSKHFQESIKDLSKLISTNKSNSQAYYYRAKAYHGLGKDPEAIKDLTLTIELDGSGFHYYVERAALYFATNQLDLADADYKRAIELRPDIPSLYYNRGITLMNLSHNEQAIRHFMQCLQLEADNIPAFNSLATLLFRLQRYHETIKTIQSRTYYNDTLLNLKALSLKALGFLQQARDVFTKMIEQFDSFQGYVGRGATLINLNRTEEALKDYEKAVAKDSKNVSLLYNTAATLQMLGRHKQAVGYFTKVLELDDQNIMGLKGRARAYYKLSQMEEFQQDINRVQELEKKH